MSTGAMARELKILMAHNRYLQPGGEDESVRAELAMLRAAGHDVDLWEVTNEEVAALGRVSTGISAVWSRRAVAELRHRLANKPFDLLHVQNPFPLLSPAIHRVAAARGVATVQHLRNYRMMCVNSTFFRNGHACRDCARSFAPWRGVLRGCYRDSAAASLAPAAMVAAHRAIGTFERDIDAYVAISGHVREAHVTAGFPADRIHVRYNTVQTADAVEPGERRAAIVLPSRLTPEKGVGVAIEAWRRRQRQAILHIAGSGPDEARLRGLAGNDPTIRFEGQVPHEKLMALMRGAAAVVNASLWPEPFGRTPMEAFALGTPAIVSCVGGLAEIVTHGENGMQVPPGDVDALDAAMTAMLTPGAAADAMRVRARARFEASFSPAAILPRTEAIYAAAMARRERRRRHGRQTVGLAHV